jgi:hypothetical protein|tara:strand:- start:91 stop:315 length:225 start_codon:yes stop_codon:yes gene_type:complete
MVSNDLIMKHGSSFCSELSDKDLTRLRNVLRHMFKTRTKRHDVSDHELDKWIESVGERTRQKTIQQAVDRKLVS